MFCNNCGAKIDDNANFCPNCQTQIRPASTQAAAENKYAPSMEPFAFDQPVPEPLFPPTETQNNNYQNYPTDQAPYYAPPASATSKSRVVAGILGILFGALGIHKFYLGNTKAGVIMLLASIIGSIITLGLSAAAMSIIGLIEGIIYLTKTDEDFYYMYEVNKKEWF